MSSNAPTAKMQPTQKTEADAGQVSKTSSNQPPAMLEEDDEFEDFPVEGRKSHRREESRAVRETSNFDQTGHKKTPRCQVAMHTFGRKAGMTMTRMRISVSN